MKSLPVAFSLKKLQAYIKDTRHRDDCAQMGLDVLLGLKDHREIYHSGDIEYGLMVALEQATCQDTVSCRRIMDANEIAELIHHWASDQALLIDALADYFEAEADKCKWCGKHWVGKWEVGPEGDDRVYCPECFTLKRIFDRTKFLRIAKGE